MRARTESCTSSLHVGIDFGQKRVDLCVLRADGTVVDAHQGFANSLSGYRQATAYLLAALQAEHCPGVRLAAEATSYYWLPFFLQLAHEPVLQGYQVQLYLQNARQVHWYKKSAGEDDKSDTVDPYYIAEHLRTRQQPYPWSPALEWLALRFYTRLHFHLMQQLVREKNYALAHLFVQHSAYGTTKPFADPFGATSRRLLTDAPTWAALTALPVSLLAQRLDELSGSRLPEPEQNAQKLLRVAAESFPLAPALAEPLQGVLQVSVAQQRYLEQQLQQVDAWIARAVEQHYPQVACLDSVPGLGPVLSAGLAAEIGDLSRFFQGQKWDKRHKCWRPKTLRDVEDAVANFAGLCWPRDESGERRAEDRRLSKHGNRYLRYYLIQAADSLRRHLPEYQAFYAGKYQEVRRHRHKRALVLTARKSVGLVVGLLHRQECYRAQEGTPTP